MLEGGRERQQLNSSETSEKFISTFKQGDKVRINKLFNYFHREVGVIALSDSFFRQSKEVAIVDFGDSIGVRMYEVKYLELVSREEG